MSLTTAQKEKIVKLVIKDKISVSKLAGENDIARKTIYSWVKLYRNAASRNKKKALVTKYVSGKKHPKHKEVLLLEDKIIRIVKKNPQLSISGISKTLKAGRHAVYNALKALELTTEDSRLAFSNLYKFPGVLDPSIKISVVNSVLSNKKSITTLAKENHVARKTIYEWIKEFKAEGNVEEDYVSGFEHPRAYSETKVEAILSGVVNNPAFSIHKLAASLGLSSHGVYNVLFRYGLTHSGARFAYAQNIPSAEEKPSFNFFTRVIPLKLR